jgi:hypothetical protein
VIYDKFQQNRLADLKKAQMRRDIPIDERPPLAVSALVAVGIVALVGGAVALSLIFGPAILLDLAAGAGAFVCL